MARRLLEVDTTMTGLSLRRRAASRGFTLVELAVVVVIVGVLSMIAVVGYRKLILSGKLTEGRNMVNGIRIAQEEYKTERGTYANMGTTMCPIGAGAGGVKVQWDPTCNGGNFVWEVLPIHTDGPVEFGYATVAGNNAAATGLGVEGWVTGMANIPADRPWYIVLARSNLDNDTGTAPTEIAATSHANTLYTRNEGQ